MGVSTKKRRKLTVNNRLYVWYVKEDYDFPNYVLHVFSDDKQFIVHYHLRQSSDIRHIIVHGPDFPRVAGTGGVWRRFRCPEWGIENGAVTPRTVRNLIDWCQSSGNTTEVDYVGKAVPLGGCCISCGVNLRGMIPISSNCCHKCGYPVAERAG